MTKGNIPNRRYDKEYKSSAVKMTNVLNVKLVKCITFILDKILHKTVNLADPANTNSFSNHNKIPGAHFTTFITKNT